MKDIFKILFSMLIGYLIVEFIFNTCNNFHTIEV